MKKLGKSRKGASESSVWDFIREKDKQALEEGAFMETFAGKAVESVVYFLCFLIILWEIYLNTCLDETRVARLVRRSCLHLRGVNAELQVVSARSADIQSAGGTCDG